MDFKGTKQIVRYRKNTVDRIQPFIELQRRAYVYALDHPRLGEQYVSTSSVLCILYSHEGVLAFETHNTIYVLDTYVIPE